MICPKCQTTNIIGSRYCNQCGHQLLDGQKNRTGWGAVFSAAVMITAVGVLLFAAWMAYQQLGSSAQDPRRVSDHTNGDFASRETAKPLKKTVPPVPQAKKRQPMVIAVGNLVIEDITGKPLRQMVVPIVDAGWIALPMHLSIGGQRWYLWVERSKQTTIEGGVFRDFDQIGIWQTASPPAVKGPPLAPWNDAAPLDWYALERDAIQKGITMTDCEPNGYFVRCDLPYGISGQGVFYQDNAVVGWTFATGARGAFLWNGLKGADLKIEVRLDDHYRLTFADSREEKWLTALSMDTANSMRRLEALLEAYQYPRKVVDGHLPERIKPELVIKLLQNLAAEMADAGYRSEVVNLFDRQTLLEINHPDLVIQMAQLTGQVYGSDAAIDTIEWVKDYLSMGSAESGRLNKIHLEFYVRLLEELANRGDWTSVAQRLSTAQTVFPDDPRLLLIEVRLALANGAWNTAERLLSAYVFPESLSGQVMALQAEIDRAKATDGRVVIRFRPGSRNIRVTAELNGELAQPFLIDTGASTVTIPTATARRLGIPLGGSSSIRTVITAGGQVTAREVTIDEISLDGWTVRQVTALVLDIPGQPDLGLLGLNYLSRFDMDLQPEKGLLTLTPK